MVSGAVSPILITAAIGIKLPELMDVIMILAVPVFITSLILSIKSGIKPAAWINQEILFIRDGLFRVESIPLKIVEAMKYETGGKNTRDKGAEMHILTIKMEGYSEWELPIRDMIEHGKDLRLYKFINENFYKLHLIKL